MLIAVSAVLSFYITYFAYRNLKSFLPVLREATFDSALLHLDHALLWGNDPAVLLHDVLGTGVAGDGAWRSCPSCRPGQLDAGGRRRT